MIASGGMRRALLGLVSITMRTFYAYRFQYLGNYVMVALQLFMLTAVWRAVYGDRESLDGIAVQTQLVFVTIAAFQSRLLNIQLAWSIQARVVSGDVALDLIRPVAFIPHMMAQQVGRTIGGLPHLVFVVPIVLLLGTMTPPAPGNVLPYVASLLLAYAIGLLTWTAVGLITIWLLNINAIRATLQMTADVLGGALVPLWFMPDWLRFVLELLPFNAIFFLPASIYAGQVTGSELVRPFVTQAIWIVLLIGLVHLVWQRGQRRLVVQGG